MRRATLIAFSAAVIGGCWEADPDKDTLGELRQTISTFPLEIKYAMGKWAANRFAAGYVHGEPFIGHVLCIDWNKPRPSNYLDLTIEATTASMLKCLDDDQTMSFKQCLDKLLGDIQDDHDEECRWQSFHNKFWETRRPYQMDPERVALEEAAQTLTRALLGPPPPIEIQLMLMGLPGIMGPAGALCPQGVSWACAPALGDQPGVTSSAASGGGDR